MSSFINRVHLGWVAWPLDAHNFRPVVVPMPRINPIMKDIVLTGEPAQSLLISMNSRWSMGFHFEQSFRWLQTVTGTPNRLQTNS
jgi:hypothetical protein